MSGLDGFRWKKGKKERSPPHTRTDHENLRPPLFLNSSFSSLLPPSTFVRPHSSLCLIPPPPPIFLMVKTVGPWQLDDVKARLRAEQVGRERAASARYRAQEQRDLGEDNTIAKNAGKTSWAHCIYLLALSCLLLSLSVLAFLVSAFLSLVKK
jgi:hypothetical protein